MPRERKKRQTGLIAALLGMGAAASDAGKRFKKFKSVAEELKEREDAKRLADKKALELRRSKWSLRIPSFGGFWRNRLNPKTHTYLPSGTIVRITTLQRWQVEKMAHINGRLKEVRKTKYGMKRRRRRLGLVA